MGEGLTIESEEAASLATTLRDALERGWAAKEGAAAHHREDAEYLELREIVDDIHRRLQHPLLSWDHSWLYDDETGLPR